MVCKCGHNKIFHSNWEGTMFDNGRNTGECKYRDKKTGYCDCPEYTMVQRSSIKVMKDV